MLSTEHAIAERSISWMGIRRRCLAPDAQSAVGASLRGLTTVGWRGLRPRDKRKALGACLPVERYVLVSYW